MASSNLGEGLAQKRPRGTFRGTSSLGSTICTVIRHLAFTQDLQAEVIHRDLKPENVLIVRLSASDALKR